MFKSWISPLTELWASALLLQIALSAFFLSTCQLERDVLMTSRNVLILGQMYRAVTGHCVACMTGCEIEWSELNSVQQNLAGTKRWGTPVDVSHTIVVSDVGTALRMREEGEDWGLRTSESSCWTAVPSPWSGQLSHGPHVVHWLQSVTMILLPSCQHLWHAWYLKNVIEVMNLSWGVPVRMRCEDICQRFVVCKNVECAAFHKVSEVFDWQEALGQK